MAIYDELGREIPDPRPVEVPVHLKVGPSLQERIRQAIRQELSDRAYLAGQETFEQADDFEVDDEEPELMTPYQELAPESVGGKDASDLSRPEPPFPAKQTGTGEAPKAVGASGGNPPPGDGSPGLKREPSPAPPGGAA